MGKVKAGGSSEVSRETTLNVKSFEIERLFFFLPKSEYAPLLPSLEEEGGSSGVNGMRVIKVLAVTSGISLLSSV